MSRFESLLVNLAGISAMRRSIFPCESKFRQKTTLSSPRSSDILTNDPARDRRFRADRSAFPFSKGFEIMAVKKSSKTVSASKKAGGKKSAAKKVAPKKSTKSAAKSAAKKAPKKAAPTKLTATQTDLLKKIGESGEPGYKSDKKAEQRTIDALQERKLIKRGAKDKASGSYHYLISNTGKKFLGSSTPASSTPASPPPATPT
jgi:hypothetical protein